MASTTSQFVIRMTMSQESRGDHTSNHFLAVCEHCGKNVTEMVFSHEYNRNEVASLKFALMTHATTECIAIPYCPKPECRLSRHYGECFHDGGTR